MHWTLQNTVWIACMIVVWAIAVSAIYQKLWKVYPAFVSYILCEIARSLSLFAIGTAHYAPYFYTYWITECILVLLGFVVVREIFSKVLSAHFGLHRWGATVFWGSLAILILIAVLAAIGAKGGDPDKLVAAILLLKRVEALVRLGLVVALLVFVIALGIPLADPLIGIAAGFGIYGAGELVAFTIRSSWGRRAHSTTNWTIMGIALCEHILWLAYLIPFRESSGKFERNRSPDAKPELDKLQDAIGIFLER